MRILILGEKYCTVSVFNRSFKQHNSTKFNLYSFLHIADNQNIFRDIKSMSLNNSGIYKKEANYLDIANIKSYIKYRCVKYIIRLEGKYL